MKKLSAYIFEFSAVALTAYGFWEIYKPVGYITAGAGAFYYSLGISK